LLDRNVKPAAGFAARDIQALTYERVGIHQHVLPILARSHDVTVRIGACRN
jgi:hypothetical protein